MFEGLFKALALLTLDKGRLGFFRFLEAALWEGPGLFFSL